MLAAIVGFYFFVINKTGVVCVNFLHYHWLQGNVSFCSIFSHPVLLCSLHRALPLQSFARPSSTLAAPPLILAATASNPAR